MNLSFALCLGFLFSSASVALEAQNTLEEFIYKTVQHTPASGHSSEFIPGALIEVPFDGKHSGWQPLDYREKEKRSIHTPAVEELSAGQDPFQTNKPTNFKLGLDSIKPIFRGASVAVTTNKNHEITVSEIKEKGYVLVGDEDQKVLKTGALHDWLLNNYFTYPSSGVAYFMIKRVYTAQYAEIKVDKGLSVSAAVGKDLGDCKNVQLPDALHAPVAQGSGGAHEVATASRTEPAQRGGPAQETEATHADFDGVGQATPATIHLGGTFCRPDVEHVRFFAEDWTPIALDVELITRRNDDFDFKAGVVRLPLYDNRQTSAIARSVAR